MKIGIDIRNIGKKRTGDEQVFFNLVKNLALLDDKNEYCLFTDITDTTLLYSNVVKPLGIEGKNNFKVISLECSNKFIWNAWILPKYLRKNPVDVYHTQYITPFFVSKNIKIVTTVHDISFNYFPQLIKWTDLLFLKLLIPISLKRADKIIAVSQFTKDEIVKYYKIKPEKIEVVCNAIGDNFLKNNYTDEELKRVKDKYNLPEKFILYLGTMQPRKNLPFLIEGYAKIRPQISDLKLVIAGKKGGHNFDKKIDDAIVDNVLENEIIFTDYVDEGDKPLLYNLAELFVMPSLYEGFGLPLLEAMSQNIPVLSSRIEALEEVGNGAVEFFEIENLDEFSQKLYNLIINKNDREKLASSGFERVRFFSWEKSALELLKIYTTLK